MKYYIEAIKKYTNFYGRATRTEFWMYELFNAPLIFLVLYLDRTLGTQFKYDLGAGVKLLPFGYFFAFYELCVFMPTIALHIRRMHDIGKSGWFLFIVLIPVVGAIWLLILYCTPSSPAGDKYNFDPALLEE